MKKVLQCREGDYLKTSSAAYFTLDVFAKKLQVVCFFFSFNAIINQNVPLFGRPVGLFFHSVVNKHTGWNPALTDFSGSFLRDFKGVRDVTQDSVESLETSGA